VSRYLPVLLAPVLCAAAWAAPESADLQLNAQGYFEAPGLNVMVFEDIYPDGHQTGVSVIQHGRRVAANGDLRLEASPGQWSPVPAAGERIVDVPGQRIRQQLAYPDPAKNGVGFNPIDYPDLALRYAVTVEALEGARFAVTVDLDTPLPAEWVGRVGFNLELFPGDLFGKSWLLDGAAGQFPRQANGPLVQEEGAFLTAPLARGRRLTVAPGEDLQRLTVTALSGELALLDGRGNHNNGWYIVRGLVPAGATAGAVRWEIEANMVAGWRYPPVIQVSQLGYAPAQQKRVILEQDGRDDQRGEVVLYRLAEDGPHRVTGGSARYWGQFLRYNYLTYDFSDVTEPGLYRVEYRGRRSHAFRIARDVYARHAWQPTLEYFLPVQMCHMRVVEQYRVWHGLCHDDDARMAPVAHNHFDGYLSGPSTLTAFEPLQPVPGLNRGGWHDAGDYDLRVESQSRTTWLLAMMVEEFGLDYDATSIDQQRRLVQIHRGDGINDALQQIEHGLLTVLGGYEALGRPYRGIIVPTLGQYVHLGDAATQTDNRVTATAEGADDRWVFTEQNPDRDLLTAAGLAAAGRVLAGHDAALARRALAAARALYASASGQGGPAHEVLAATELALATGEPRYVDAIEAREAEILDGVGDTAWALGRVLPRLDPGFAARLGAAVAAYRDGVAQEGRETPYGVPYKPHIWGAGWGIQEFAVRQYFLNRAWPRPDGQAAMLNALNFVLGVHPGENTLSFASGVGAHSAEVAYGVNRADWSFIPGGVISGTALIRPDLPELKVWPYFWQQTEYVVGGGATNFMFLVLAADALFAGGET
jgi:endoglucanase